MKPFLFILSLLILFWNSQVFSKTWVDYTVIKDMTYMTEYQKSYEYLNESGEVYLAIYPDSPLDLKPLVNVLSIERVEDNNIIFAYANKEAFEEFLKYNFYYEALIPPGLHSPVTMSDYKDYLENGARADWYKYPTYDAYEDIMNKFESDYPQICKYYDFGPSVQNRRILGVRISDNVGKNEPEPRALFTSTIHGNEIVNYMFCLHMIDTILSSYGNDVRLTNLVDSLEMWFCPNLNPDGTYRNGNSTVSGANYYNANSKNLNRNWPCPCMQGNHKYYGIYDSREKETEAIFNLHEMYRFNLQTDFHSGTETCLWPYGSVWDNICDEAWYKWVAERYVDQVHSDCNNNGYMTSCGDGTGHTISELYECHGTRLDYCPRFAQAKGITIETNLERPCPESELQKRWMWNKEALFQYLELLYTGIQGVVYDAGTGEPFNHVNVIEKNHDVDSADVYTDSTGYYVRFIEKGTWDLTFSHPDFDKDTTIKVQVDDYSKLIRLDVAIGEPSSINNGIISVKNKIKITPFCRGIKIDGLGKNAKIGIYTISGKLVSMLPASNSSIIECDGRDSNGKAMSNGCYIVKIKSGNQNLSKSFILNR